MVLLYGIDVHGVIFVERVVIDYIKGFVIKGDPAFVISIARDGVVIFPVRTIKGTPVRLWLFGDWTLLLDWLRLEVYKAKLSFYFYDY